MSESEFSYQAKPMTVRELPVDQQPRELVDRDGVENVPDEVVIAVILRTGLPNQNVRDLARAMLQHYGSLTELSRASEDELRSFPGMGPVKAQILKCALDLPRRMSREGPARPIVREPGDVVNVLSADAQGLDVEHFWVLLLDAKYRLTRTPKPLTRGIADASLVHPREVFKEAVRSGATAVILAHNHPSGDPTPSSEDIRVTRKLVEAGKLMDIEVLDHVILGRTGGEVGAHYTSLRESGLVHFE